MQKEIRIEDTKRSTFLDKLEKSKKEYKEGKTHNARDVFNELRQKYGY